jgi:hypothetical protein
VVGISGGDAAPNDAPISSSLSQMLTKPVSLDAVLGIVQRWAPVEA